MTRFGRLNMLAASVSQNPLPQAVPALPVLVLSGVLAAWCMVGGDAIVREGWPYIVVAQHLTAALGLYAAIGALLGLVVWALVALERAAVGGAANGRTWLRSYAYGIVGGVASINTALWTFSGEQVSQTRHQVWHEGPGPVDESGWYPVDQQQCGSLLYVPSS